MTYASYTGYTPKNKKTTSARFVEHYRKAYNVEMCGDCRKLEKNCGCQKQKSEAGK